MRTNLVKAVFSLVLTQVLTAWADEPLSLSIQVAAPQVLKLSWDSIPGTDYRIDRSISLIDPQWETFSIEQAIDPLTRRSVVVKDPMSFYKVYPLAVRQTSSVSSFQNMVLNGDFELMKTNSLPSNWQRGGYGSNTRYFIYPVQGLNSERAAQLTISNYVNGDGKWLFDDVRVNPGQTYHLTFAYKSTVPANVTVRYTSTNGTLSYSGVLIPPASANWISAEASFVAKPDTKFATCFFALTSNGSLTIDNVVVTNEQDNSQGMISFDFDDGWGETMSNGRASLESRGFHGSFNIITSRVGREEVVTTNDVYRAWQAGHEIECHTVTHPDMTTLSFSDMETEINMSRDALLSMGVGSITSCVYPFGSYNDTVKRATREAGFKSGSSTDGGFNTKENLDLYALKRTSVRSWMTLADIKSQIDAALAQKAWFILVFHHVDRTATDYTVSPEFFDQVVDYVASKNALVVTTTEGLRLISQP